MTKKVEYGDIMRAGDIEPGQCFRKISGRFAYLRVSDASAAFYGLDGARSDSTLSRFIYGVCYNGNMTQMPVDKEVVLVAPTELDYERLAEKEWDRVICGRETVVHDPFSDPVMAAHIAREPGELGAEHLDRIRDIHGQLLRESSMYREAHTLGLIGLMARMQLAELKKGD